MAGTQGSSYSSPEKAAAGNARTTSNLKSGLNASGSSKTNSGYGSRPASSSVNAAAANAARMAAERAASTAASQRTATSQGGYGISSRTMAANYGAYNNPAATRMDSYNANSRSGAGGVPAQEAISKGKSGISASLNPQESAYQGKGGFNPTQPSIASMIGSGISNAISRFGQMAATPFGAAPSPMQSPLNNGLAQYDALAGLGSPYARSTNAIVAGDPMRVGYNPVDDITSVSPDPISEWGNKMGGYGIQAAARGVETLAKTIPKSTDRVPVGTSPTQTAAAGYRSYDPVAELNRPSSYPNSVSVAAREPVGYSPMQTLQNPARAFPTRAIAAPTENYNWNGSPNIAAANAAAMNQAFNVNSMPKVAMEGGIPGGISPDSVPNLPNYASPVSVANREPSPYDSPTQIAGYQNPARAFPSRPAPTQSAGLLSPMAGQGASFYAPTGRGSAQAYNDAMIGSISDARYRAAMASPAVSDDPTAITDASIYDQAPTLGQQLKADAINYLDKKTAPIKSGGDYVNGLLGGTSQNNPNWQAPGNPNARDQLNNLAEKTGTTKTKATAEQIKQAVEDGKADPEYKTLSAEKKQLIAKYVREGMTYAEAKAKALGGTTSGGTGTGTGGTITRPAAYYPQYYSTWAGLPSGQRYA